MTEIEILTDCLKKVNQERDTAWKNLNEMTDENQNLRLLLAETYLFIDDLVRNEYLNDAKRTRLELLEKSWRAFQA